MKLKQTFMTAVMLHCQILNSLPAVAEEVGDRQGINEITPGEIFEECMMLSSQDALRYIFNASNELEFNLHYHTKDGIEFSLPVRSTAKQRGQYIADSEHHYCLMWENKGLQTVELIYEFQVSSRQQ